MQVRGERPAQVCNKGHGRQGAGGLFVAASFDAAYPQLLYKILPDTGGNCKNVNRCGLS
jgi:hypothetical protein